jgi:hypothetical protein
MNTALSLDAARFRAEELRRMSSRPDRLMAVELELMRGRRFRLRRRRNR